MRRKVTPPPTKKKSVIAPVVKPGNYLVVVLPDAHFGSEDPVAVEIALRIIEKLRPKQTVILGDWLEVAAFSAHPTKSLVEAVSHDFYNDEIVPCNKALDRIQAASEQTDFIEGNHEFRVERAAVQHGKIVTGVYDLISPRKLLTQGRKNFNWIPYSKGFANAKLEIAPDLWAIHGFSTAKNFTDATLAKLRSISVVTGHCHRIQSTSVRNPVTGDAITCWSPGCLSKLQPLWQHNFPTDWLHGLSLIYVKNDKTEWTQYTIHIQNGEAVLPDGSTVRA